MKKLLKKIGVLGLIIALFAPFIELPTVNAAEGCTNHLQNYLWLDMNYFNAGTGKGETFMEGYSKDKNEDSVAGYLNYANFPFAFKDTNNYKVTIKSVTTNNLSDDKSYDNFWAAWNKTTTDITEYEIDSNIGGTLVRTQDNTPLGNYTDDTILLHGVWSSLDKSGEPLDPKWKEKVIDGKEYSLQPVLKSKNDVSKMSIKFNPAKLEPGSNNFKSDSSELDADYFQKIVDEKYNVFGSEGKNYIPLSITRTLNLSANEIKDMLNKYVFGEKSGDSWLAFSTTADKGNKKSDVEDSYSALIATSRETVVVDEKDIDFDTSKPYYWPAVLSVEYEACPLAKENWTLVYDGNVGDNDNSVTNLPNSQTTDLGNDITVDSKKPSRTDYTFTKWCETKEGSGTCYNAGDKVKSPDSAKTITLYAQWGKGGTEDNKKTGVMSYVIGFMSVGVIAGGIYLVAKKKNLFKQI